MKTNVFAKRRRDYLRAAQLRCANVKPSDSANRTCTRNSSSGWSSETFIDQEVVTRTFPDGTGQIELIATYLVREGRIAKAWFIFGAKTLDARLP